MKRLFVLFAMIAVWAVAVYAQAETVAYWRFEGNNGTAVAGGDGLSGATLLDETSYGNNLSVYGSATTYQGDDAGELFGSQVLNPDATDVPGNGTYNSYGANTRSLLFSGATYNYLYASDDDSLDFAGAFTVEGYFNLNSNASNCNLVNKRNSGNGNGWKIAYVRTEGESDYCLVFLADTGASTAVVWDNEDIVAGQYYHFAAVREADGTMHLYLDGVQDTYAATTEAGDLSSSASVRVGLHEDNNSAAPLNGYIDEVRLSNVALTPDQFLNSEVPEPSTLALLGCGLIGLLAYAWRKRK